MLPLHWRLRRAIHFGNLAVVLVSGGIPAALATLGLVGGRRRLGDVRSAELKRLKTTRTLLITRSHKFPKKTGAGRGAFLILRIDCLWDRDKSRRRSRQKFRGSTTEGKSSYQVVLRILRFYSMIFCLTLELLGFPVLSVFEWRISNNQEKLRSFLS